MCCRHTRGKSSFPAVLYAGLFQLEPPKLLLYCRGVCHVLLSGSVITGSLWPSSPIVPFCTDDALLHRLAWIGSSFHHRVQAMLSRIFKPGSSFQNCVQAMLSLHCVAPAKFRLLPSRISHVESRQCLLLRKGPCCRRKRWTCFQALLLRKVLPMPSDVYEEEGTSLGSPQVPQ
jgi:hypothetical protein